MPIATKAQQSEGQEAGDGTACAKSSLCHSVVDVEYSTQPILTRTGVARSEKANISQADLKKKIIPTINNIFPTTSHSV